MKEKEKLPVERIRSEVMFLVYKLKVKFNKRSRTQAVILVPVKGETRLLVLTGLKWVLPPVRFCWDQLKQVFILVSGTREAGLTT